MRIIMHPNDVLFLNSGREFTAGETHLGVSLPFVPPHTVAGAIRSAMYVKNAEAFNDLIKPGEEEPGFEILGVFFWKDEELFPLPADVVEDEEGRLVQVSMDGGVITASGSIHFRPAEGLKGFIRKRDLIEYLDGKRVDFERTLVPAEEIYTLEDRIGVGLGDNKTSLEGLLYRTRNLRLKEGTGITVWLGERGEDVRNALGESGLLRLGGEGRFVKYSFDETAPEFPKTPEKNNVLKLYVATPLVLTIERNGRYYSTWDVTEELSTALGVEKRDVHIEWFFSGGITPLTGWDMKNNHPKAVRYAVSPGSVYYVRINTEVDEVPPYLKLGHLKKLGYGLVFLGKAEKDEVVRDV